MWILLPAALWQPIWTARGWRTCFKLAGTIAIFMRQGMSIRLIPPRSILDTNSEELNVFWSKHTNNYLLSIGHHHAEQR